MQLIRPTSAGKYHHLPGISAIEVRKTAVVIYTAWGERETDPEHRLDWFEYFSGSEYGFGVFFTENVEELIASADNPAKTAECFVFKVKSGSGEEAKKNAQQYAENLAEDRRMVAIPLR